jgi:hypothetical protein
MSRENKKAADREIERKKWIACRSGGRSMHLDAGERCDAAIQVAGAGAK